MVTGRGMLRRQADFAKQMMNMGYLTKAPQTMPPMAPEAPRVSMGWELSRCQSGVRAKVFCMTFLG